MPGFNPMSILLRHPVMKIFLLLFILVPLSMSGQSQRQWIKYGNKSFQERDYYGASLYYRKAMLLDSGNLEVVYRYAEALRSYNEYQLGEKYYHYVFKKDLGTNFKEALFWLASMQKYNAKYQDARKNFIKFANFCKDKNSYFYKKAKQEIGSCEFAQALMQDTVPVAVINLGPSVNSVNAEFSPIVLNDSSIFFSSLRSDKIREVIKGDTSSSYHIKIFSAVRKDTGWIKKNEISPFINSNLSHNGNGAFDSSETKFYFTRCDDQFNCSIYASSLEDGKWSEPKMVEGGLNMPGYTSTQPSITTLNKKEFMFFSSDRPGGEGKFDVWYGPIEGGKVTEIYNAGKVINSIDDELTPRYDAERKMLYFSSGWHYGLGGFDIFSAAGMPGRFGKPVNLGYPVNTSANDFYYTLLEKSGNGFLTSNRKGSITAKGETCCDDLWYFEGHAQPDTVVPVPLPTLNELEAYIPVRLYFHNDAPDPKSLDTITALNYMETYKAYTGMKDIYKKEYGHALKENKREASDEIENFFRDAVDKGAANLEQFTEQLLPHLEKGERLEVTVKGYASPLAKTDYNINLTLRRISSMENYMKQYKNGILLPYFNDSAANHGHISIVRIPFGEYNALAHVNDNLKELQHSVYSPDAARERKIEIVSVAIAHSDSLKPVMKFQKEIFNFGIVTQGDTLQHSFVVKNTGKAMLIIHAVRDSCECLIVNPKSMSIAPGKKGEIEVTLFTDKLSGKQIKHIWVESNATTPVKELTLTTDIKED